MFKSLRYVIVAWIIILLIVKPVSLALGTYFDSIFIRNGISLFLVVYLIFLYDKLIGDKR